MNKNDAINRISNAIEGYCCKYDGLTFLQIALLIEQLMREDNVISWVMCDDFVASWIESNGDRIEKACIAGQMNRDQWRQNQALAHCKRLNNEKILYQEGLI